MQYVHSSSKQHTQFKQINTRHTWLFIRLLLQYWRWQIRKLFQVNFEILSFFLCIKHTNIDSSYFEQYKIITQYISTKYEFLMFLQVTNSHTINLAFQTQNFTVVKFCVHVMLNSTVFSYKEWSYYETDINQ